MEAAELGEEEKEFGDKLIKLTLDAGTIRVLKEDPSVCGQALVNAY